MPGIVVGIDGSRSSQHALEWAAREAALRGTALTVLTVHQVARSAWTGNPVTSDADAADEAAARKAAQDVTDKVIGDLGDGQPSSVTVSVVSGLIAHELISAGQDADLLVVGSRGHGGFASLRLGSVSSQVASHAECPVVVVHSKA
jgi:nucleotide-binding universal stress UspA family protein